MARRRLERAFGIFPKTLSLRVARAIVAALPG